MISVANIIKIYDNVYIFSKKSKFIWKLKNILTFASEFNPQIYLEMKYASLISVVLDSVLSYIPVGFIYVFMSWKHIILKTKIINMKRKIYLSLFAIVIAIIAAVNINHVNAELSIRTTANESALVSNDDYPTVNCPGVGKVLCATVNTCDGVKRFYKKE
ncbi:MAG: hypothetical protein LBR13_02280 [Dysgonamonadaceae bacterium]|jgi:hypothetical protein|nr:hypothetical protein [Dysgonamonadaceae bacterium]